MSVEIIITIIGLFLSPTYWIAFFLKRAFRKNRVIRILNWFYLGVSILSFITLVFLWKSNIMDVRVIHQQYFYLAWSIFLLSRCSEIFYAFLFDAYDKLKDDIGFRQNKKIKINYFVLCLRKTVNNSLFNWVSRKFSIKKIEIHERLLLAFKSYFELIINFSILFSLLPLSYWKSGSAPCNILDSLYFSGVTISTLGYGDIIPYHWYPKFLTIFEVFSGFTLIIVCFAIYLSRNQPRVEIEASSK